MTTLLLAALLIGSAMLLMAVGVMVSGKRLRGSCGGKGCECSENGLPPKACHKDGASHSESGTLSIAP